MSNAARAEEPYSHSYSYGGKAPGDRSDSVVLHETGSHTDSHAESSAGLPQLDVSTFPGQLFWLTITFGIMYLIFSRKSLPEISGTLERRQLHIESDLESAERLKSEADSVLSAYEASLGKARAESAKILHDVQNSIKALTESHTGDFHAKAEKDIEALDKKLFALKEGLMEDMNVIAAETAREAAKKIVGIQTDLEQAKTVVKALNIPSAKAA